MSGFSEVLLRAHYRAAEKYMANPRWMSVEEEFAHGLNDIPCLLVGDVNGKTGSANVSSAAYSLWGNAPRR